MTEMHAARLKLKYPTEISGDLHCECGAIKEIETGGLNWDGDWDGDDLQCDACGSRWRITEEVSLVPYER